MGLDGLGLALELQLAERLQLEAARELRSVAGPTTTPPAPADGCSRAATLTVSPSAL